MRASAAMLEATAGDEPGAPDVAPAPARPCLKEVGAKPGKLRIAFSARPLLGKNVDPDCVAALERTAKLLQELGHIVEETPFVIDRESVAKAFLLMLVGEVRADIEMAEKIVGRKARSRDFEVPTWLLGLFGKQYSAAEYATEKA